ncbi:PIG-L family deacetylase [Candidatus Bathyarchaeota archaeon]|nr:PIG-L family deacetylase [Candidatus Bathyarchaeota archaeon]
MTKRVVVFAPHPDDETFGCGGLIAKKIRDGYEVIIVEMTDGRNLFKSILNVETNPSPEDVKKIRKEEVLKATQILGVPKKNIVFLDFKDGTLKEYEDEAVEKVAEILRRYSPVEVYFPYMHDCHLDHQATNRIVRKTLHKLGMTPIKYQFSILHKHAIVGPLIDRILNLFRKNMIRLNVSDVICTKEKAIKEFKSEISIVSINQKKPLEKKVNRYLKNNETFYIMTE